MTSNTSLWSKFVCFLPQKAKNLLQLTYDLIGLGFSFIVSVTLANVGFNQQIILLGIYFYLAAVLLFRVSGVYKAVIQFSGIHLLTLIILSQFISVGSVLFISSFNSIGLPLVFFILLFLISTFALGGGRLLAREMGYRSRPSGQRLLIYGAGSAGRQLLTSLMQDLNYEVIAFIDDDKHLQGRKIHGLEVISSSSLNGIINKKNIEIVVLAIPNASRKENLDIISKLEFLNVCVKSVPKISEILDGTTSISSLQEVDIERLLGREPVPPNEKLLVANIFDKVVLVTGAGGSIGSELCRQIVTRSPTKLILVDHSELALYKIQQELEANWGNFITPILASICDQELMTQLIMKEKIETIYHAAAYKHVPLVEANPFASIHNNTFGTQRLLNAAKIGGAVSFNLISTDKAVRPTNVMGASKRLAEIMCQIESANSDNSMRISMVRFGNVLGSSGSVIPKFREQIKNGGPVTVTHPEITRYFMLIPEAVELVLQASSMAKKGEVFLLDMGEPIKIADLAEKLIKLSGKMVDREERLTSGKIAIEFSGLRPGEKLYEELLISGDAEDTQHPKIKKISENYPGKIEFDSFLNELKKVCNSNNEDALLKLLANGGIGYSQYEEYPVNNQPAFNAEELIRPTISSYNIIEEPLVSDSENMRNSDIVSNSEIIIEKKGFWRNIALKLLNNYFLISRPLTVGVRCLILNEKQEVLLVNHAYVSGWHLPGGGVDSGESASVAIVREVIEETGLILDELPTLIGIFHNKEVTKRDHVILYVANRYREGESVISSFEIKSSNFFSLENLPNDMDPSSREWLTYGIDHLNQAK